MPNPSHQQSIQNTDKNKLFTKFLQKNRMTAFCGIGGAG
jgi:hypothetical protein